MNDLNQPMSHLPQSQTSNQPIVMNQPPLMTQPQIINQSKAMGQASMINQSQLVMKPSQLLSQSQIMSRSFGMWPSLPIHDSASFPNQGNLGFPTSKPRRSNWKGKKASNKLMEIRRKEKSGSGGSSGSGGGVYMQPPLHELQSKNRLKARKFYPKRKFNPRFAPFAPRNTTSYIIRAKKAGGIASLVSPCPVTPAVLPTPIFSPSREVLVDMAKEEWGVDGYGSMKGLIRLRSPEGHDEEDDEVGGGGSSESDVEEHVEVERRLAHDLSRFEMIYPSHGGENSNVLENRVDDQDTHIAQLEEENLTLKERLFLMERELGDLKIRLQCLESQNQVLEDINEEVMENGSENESGEVGDGDAHSLAENHDDGDDEAEYDVDAPENIVATKNDEEMEKMNVNKDTSEQLIKEASSQTVHMDGDGDDNGL